jgi:twitching motility protein PilT
MDITELLAFSVQHNASDLHLSTGTPPSIRVDGDVRKLNIPAFDAKDVNALVYDIMNDGQRKEYEENLEVDFSFEVPNLARFRVNAFNQNRGPAAVFRTIPSKILSLDDLGCPDIFRDISDTPRGLVLVTGPTGSGKSTTLAAMVDYINDHKHDHILTIEDPIEFIHFNKKSVIHQREVGRDVPSFSSAIRAAMREDPDVILLGEMRDTDTMKAALMAAETGHLVFSTLHTNDAVGVIDRVIGAFPGEEQDGVRQQLSAVLRSVITQTLVKVDNGKGRIPVNEILFVDNAVSHLIRKHRPEQIRSVLETARAAGNQSFELALAKRIQERLITKEQAYRLTSREQAVAEFLKVLQDDAVNKRQKTGGALNDS